MLPGDFLIMLDGIYTVPTATGIIFGDAYAASDKRVTVQADAGARPIITGDDGNPPQIELMAYTILDGVWAGGTYDAALYPASYRSINVKSECIIRNCTFWGYLQGILQTDTWHDDLYQNNRFVRMGSPFCHAFYITDTDLAAHSRAYIRDNLVVRNFRGASVDIYREANDCEVTGNFIEGESGSGLYLQTENDLVSNNYFGRSLVGDIYGIVSIGNVAEFVNFRHNFIVGDCSWPDAPISPITIDGNAYFIQDPPVYDNNPPPEEAHPILVHPGEEAAYLGMTEPAINDICDLLEAAFSQTTLQIHDDALIEGYFTTLKNVMDFWKALDAP